MTDKEKLIAVFEAFDIEWDEPITIGPPAKSITAARRKFYFTSDGEIERIIDYDNPHPAGVRA